VRGNSSAPILAPSSNFHRVRIQSAKPTNCAGHRATTDGLDLARDQKCGLVEETKAGEATAGKEIRICIPYGRCGRTDLSKEKGSHMEGFRYGAFISNAYRQRQR
jgi:hypothetical protein